MSLYLAKDQRSNDVVALQHALNTALQPATALVLDGIFGPLTEGATRQFQKRESLTVDGIAGPKTLGALFEGVDVVSRINVVAAEDRPRDARFRSPFSPPQIPKKRDIAFGTIGILDRELRFHHWLLEDTPKSPLPPLLRMRQPLTLEAMRRRLIPIERLRIGQRPARVVKRIPATKALGIEIDLGSSTSDFEEFEYEFKFRMMQLKAARFLRPSVSLKSSPEGAWKGTVSVSTSPFEIPDVKWKFFSAELKPLVSASLTAPLSTPWLLGSDPSKRETMLKFFAGAEAEAAFGPSDGPRSFQFFLGAKVGTSGFLKFEDNKIESGLKAFDFTFETGIRLRFKLKPTRK